MTNELAEKVAKAIYGEGPGIPSWDTLKVIAPEAAQSCIDAALRAIRVMRDVTSKETIQ